MRRLSHWLQSLDWVLVIVPTLLVTFGLAMIFALGQAQNRPDLFWSQLIYVVIASVVFITAATLDYRVWRSSAWVAYLLGLSLLILVLVIGRAQFGAQRWIDLGAFQLQPAELMKAMVIFCVARLLGGHIGSVGWRRYASVVGIVLIVVAGLMLLTSRLSWREVLVGIMIALVSLGLGWLSLRGYQRARIDAFLNRADGAAGANYNVAQSVIAVGSGGLTGTGIGRGSQSGLNFLPVAHTDFIFATVAEATGLLGTGTLILLYTLLIWRIWWIALAVRDGFAMLVAVGVGAMFLIQTGVNIGMNVGLLPVAWIPLPLVSHGGSSLIVTTFLLGVIQSQYRRRLTQRLVE